MPRKKLEISEETVAAMAFAGSPTVEIAEFLCCNEGTIRKRFSDILTKERAGRRIKLRQAQWKVAMSGNVTMLIFLGKHELGQSEGLDAFNIDVSKLSDEELRALEVGKMPPRLQLLKSQRGDQ